MPFLHFSSQYWFDLCLYYEKTQKNTFAINGTELIHLVIMISYCHLQSGKAMIHSAIVPAVTFVLSFKLLEKLMFHTYRRGWRFLACERSESQYGIQYRTSFKEPQTLNFVCVIMRLDARQGHSSQIKTHPAWELWSKWTCFAHFGGIFSYLEKYRNPFHTSRQNYCNWNTNVNEMLNGTLFQGHFARLEHCEWNSVAAVDGKSMRHSLS